MKKVKYSKPLFFVVVGGGAEGMEEARIRNIIE